MKTREQLQQEYNEAIDYGDFYRASDIKDEFEIMDRQESPADLERRNMLEEIASLKETVKQYEDEIEANLSLIPGCIRVREGGGPENLRASLAVNIARLLRKIEFTQQREAALEKAAKSLLEKNPNFLDVVGQPG